MLMCDWSALFGIDMLCILSDLEVVKYDVLKTVNTELLYVVSDDYELNSLLC